jgi:hypothetical protein
MYDVGNSRRAEDCTNAKRKRMQNDQTRNKIFESDKKFKRERKVGR